MLSDGCKGMTWDRHSLVIILPLGFPPLSIFSTSLTPLSLSFEGTCHVSALAWVPALTSLSLYFFLHSFHAATKAGILKSKLEQVPAQSRLCCVCNSDFYSMYFSFSFNPLEQHSALPCFTGRRGWGLCHGSWYFLFFIFPKVLYRRFCEAFWQV